jgi:rubredoxin
MTIEVIKPGIRYEERSFEIECRACRAVLRFKGVDVDEGVSLRSITCPECGTGNKIPEPATTPVWDVTGQEGKPLQHP